MFDNECPDVLLGEIETCQRWESALIARQLAAIAALVARRIEDAEQSDSDPGYALVTGFARASAEVSAALNLPPMTASRLASHAESLSTRLPGVAALLAGGRVDWRTVELIITRTELVGDDVIAVLDRSLAERIQSWQCWSRRRIRNTVDAAVRALDPAAAKERRVTADNARHLSVTSAPNGMAQLRGSLPAPAAAVFDNRLSDMAKSVCAKDPRTIGARRADALLALSEGRGLHCECGRPDCPCRPAAGESEPAATHTVINVIATRQTLTGASDQPGYLEGYGVIDADQVRELAEAATLRLVECPSVTASQARRYQPSAALERWIRSRDVTCRFPGCDRPARRADIDHTQPFNHANPAAGGPTAPHNLGCYCREHHRLKTFCGGPGGWRDAQLPDGTIVWTSPTGRIYRTTPDGPELFPQLRQPCATPAPRKRNHSHEKARRIASERNTIREQRPLNAEQRRINQARRHEIEARKWRNNMRVMLLHLKGGQPSTSPWCSWINDPPEDEQLPADWRPPPPPPASTDDQPPF